MDVARLNLSHGDHADHERVYKDVRKASDQTGRAVGILVDLQGPKIRTARFEDGPIQLRRGSTSPSPRATSPVTRTRSATTYSGLPGDVTAGDRILIDDGKPRPDRHLVTETDVVRQVLEGGTLSTTRASTCRGSRSRSPRCRRRTRTTCAGRCGCAST